MAESACVWSSAAMGIAWLGGGVIIELVKLCKFVRNACGPHEAVPQLSLAAGDPMVAHELSNSDLALNSNARRSVKKSESFEVLRFNSPQLIGDITSSIAFAIY